MVTVSLGAKGVIEVRADLERREMGTRSGERHSFVAQGDGRQPGLASGAGARHARSDDGNTITIDNYPTAAAAYRGGESDDRRCVQSDASEDASEESNAASKHWIDDLPWVEANERLESQPTVNIEGLVGGYTGPGGKTVLPHRAVAKLDLRLVPDMKADGRARGVESASGQARFRRHRSEHDRRLRPDQHTRRLAAHQGRRSPFIKIAGSIPCCGRGTPVRIRATFSRSPLSLAAGHFGLGHGSGAHAPDEYYVIESTNPKVEGWDGSVLSYVQYLDELAK